MLEEGKRENLEAFTVLLDIDIAWDLNVLCWGITIRRIGRVHKKPPVRGQTETSVICCKQIDSSTSYKESEEIFLDNIF